MASYEYLGNDTFRDTSTGREITTEEFERLKAAKAAPAQGAQPKAKAASPVMGAIRIGGDLLAGVAKGAVSVPYEAARLGADIGTKLASMVRGVPEERLKAAAAAQGVDFIRRGAEVPQALKPVGTAQKAGFAAEKIGEFLLPVGSATKLSAVSKAKGLVQSPAVSRALGLGAKAAVEGGETAGRAAVQEGGLGDFGTDFLIGAAFPVAGGAFKLAGNIGGNIVKTLSSKLSGVPTAAIEEAVTNPKNVRDAIRRAAENPDVGPQTVLAKVEDAFKDLKEAQRTAYRTALETIQKDYVGAKGTAAISKDSVMDTAKKAVERVNLAIGDKGRLENTAKTLLPKSYVGELQEVYGRVKAWNDFTPLGMDDLREVLDSYRKGGVNLGKAEKQYNLVIDDMRRLLREGVAKADPRIARMNREYSVTADLVEAIRKDLSVGKDRPATAMRKLMNVFNAKSDVYRPVLDKLGEATGKDLRADIAGVLMSKLTPEGLGSYLTAYLGGSGLLALANPMEIPKLAAGALMASPRVVGGVATAYGQAAGSGIPNKVSDVLGRLGRGAAVQAMQ